MKKMIILFFLLLSINHPSECQKVDTLYYNLFNEAVSSKKYAYYRIAKQEENFVRVFDYYRTGHLKMTGRYKSFELIEKTGPFNYYRGDRVYEFRLYEPSKYPEILSSLGTVINEIPQQPDSLYLVIDFYKNNKIDAIGYRRECCFQEGSWMFFSKDGKTASVETFKNDLSDGPCKAYNQGKVTLTGFFKDDKKDGEWSFFDNDGKIYKTVFYRNGKKVKVKVK
jgi:hypothetical protein